MHNDLRLAFCFRHALFSYSLLSWCGIVKYLHYLLYHFCNTYVFVLICLFGPITFISLSVYIYSSSFNHRHQMTSIDLSHYCHISRSYVSQVVLPPYSVSCYIYIWGKLGWLLFPFLQCYSMLCANTCLEYSFGYTSHSPPTLHHRRHHYKD